jgi:hypothetical protein
MRGRTNRANERTPLANAGMTLRRIDIRVKDNGPGCLIVYVGVILIGQGRGDTKITEQHGTVVVDEEVCCFDVPVDETINM